LTIEKSERPESQNDRKARTTRKARMTRKAVTTRKSGRTVTFAAANFATSFASDVDTRLCQRYWWQVATGINDTGSTTHVQFRLVRNDRHHPGPPHFSLLSTFWSLELIVKSISIKLTSMFVSMACLLYGYFRFFSCV
jgi:hypothetical protein